MAAFRSLQNVIFETDKNIVQLAIADLFPKQNSGKVNDLVLDASLLNASGVQNVSVKTWGAATVANAIAMSPGGNLSVAASSIDVNTNIQAAGGSIKLMATINDAFPLAGQVTLAKDAVMDVSGRWINDFQQRLVTTSTDQLWLNGGSIKVSGQGDVVLANGSAIKANGGAWLSISGRLTSGKGGAIDLAAIGNGVTPSALHLGAKLSAYGLTQGGSLGLASSKIIVGESTSVVEPIPSLVLGTSNGSFNIAQDMGFNTISLNGNIDGITVKNNTVLDLKTHNLQLNNNFRDFATGSSIQDFSSVVLLPENLRQPMKLSLTGTSGLILETGSSITVDKGSTVNLLSTAGSIFVDGAINTPAGKINLSIIPISGLQYDARQAIWLGEHASLLALGDTRLNPVDALGRRSGNVLNGGDISLNANRGYVILEKGSNIDVSGTHAQLDVMQTASTGPGANYASTDIGSNAGKVSITAAEGIVLDGGIKGIAGSAKTKAGTLSLNLDRSLRNPPQEPDVNNPFPNGVLAIEVVQADEQVLSSTRFGDVIPVGLNGKMTISADKIMAGGFSDISLTTPDQVTFLDNVTLKTASRIDIDAQTINWASLKGAANGLVNLDSAYLRLGSSKVSNINVLPNTGGGNFTAKAQWTELHGASNWNGFKNITIDSTHDLRLVGLLTGRQFLGEMDTAANLNLKASQIYPSTLSTFTFAVKNNPDGQINISGTNTDTTPLSAAGNMIFRAPVINQDGVLKAPLGTISLIADKSLTLGAGSLTSVSAKDQLIPFGVIQGGLDWLYPLIDPQNLVFDKPPEKQIVLNAPAINMEKGSNINIAGGGDLFGYEFKPVTDGFPDYLQPGSASYEGGFAILPTLGSALAPNDPFQSSGSSYALGSQVYLSGTDQLPAGNYTILPAHYALLPGAFLVTPQANTQDRSVTTFTKDGFPIVSGYQTLAGTGTSDARTSAFRIESSAQVLSKHAQYDKYTANKFYADKAQKNSTVTSLLPVDSGQLSIIAQTQLLLDGAIDLATPGGRGATMDIAANNIDIVNTLSLVPTNGKLEILASDLNNLKVDSLLLGGSRTRNLDGSTNVNVTSNTVTFESGTQLQMTDLVAAAAQKVEVKAESILEAKGTVNTGDSLFNIVGDGALLRLSADKQIVLNRTTAFGVTGELVVANGATLKASKSMLLDASLSTTLLGDIVMHGGSLNLSANAINLGDVAALTNNDLNLTNQKLMNLTVDELVLNSRGNVSFYGNVGQVDSGNNPVIGSDNLPTPITFDRLVVNAAGLSGFGSLNQTARLKANNLVLANPLNAVSTVAGNGLGELNVLANNFTQGAGAFEIKGFKTVNVGVNNGFNAEGKSILTVASDLNLTTGYLTTTGGSTYKLDASGHVLNVNRYTNAIGALETGFGGSMEFIANAVNFDANALLPSGKLTLHALTEDVTVNNATIDLAGRAVTFADTVDYTPGGTFKAIADNGSILLALLATEAKLDISSGGGSAAGGSLVFKAPKSTVTLDGNIKANSGSAEFDISTFSAPSSFDNLMNVLKNAGISDSINFRSRNADIYVNTTTNANNVTLVADDGAVDIFGQFHVNAAAQGGNINIYAGDKITLENGSALTATGIKGGKVMLSSVDADNDSISGIELKDGSQIDVSGSSVSNGGNVTLRALRDGNGINIQPIAGNVTGANAFYAEGVKKYSNSDLSISGQINTVDIAKIKADTDSYMTPLNMTNVATTLGHGISLIPGVEINYTGDLTLKNTWDLVDWRYNSNPGHLAIRATGNLQIDQSLTDGFKSGFFRNSDGSFSATVSVVDQLQQGNSWSYSLAAGSDLISADTNRVSSLNNLVIGSNVKVRTGTGDMQISAGGDITITAAATSVAKKPSVNVITNNQTIRVSDSAGWKEGAYLSGPTAIAAGTTIIAINTSGINSKVTSLATAQNTKILTLSDTSGWVVGDSLSGNGVAANTTVVSINVVSKTVTMSANATAIITSGTIINNNAAIVGLSKKVTGAIATSIATPITASYTPGMIYNAGQASSSNPYGTLNDSAVSRFFYSEYPVNGGDLIVSAGGNINGTVSNNDFNNWLLRIGTWTGTSGQPTAWGVALGYVPGASTVANQGISPAPLFQQNIGSFGGGKVLINAASNITNLEVVMPTTGKPLGTNTTSNLNGFSTNEVGINGGGTLKVSAGGDVQGGSYYLGKGVGSISAGNEVKASSTLVNGPVLYSGDSQLNVNAINGVKLSGVFDPMISHKGDVNFFSYSDTSSIGVKSLAGNVMLAADNGVLALKYKPNSSQSSLSKIYPASLQVSAFGGSVILTDDIVLFPSSMGQLNIFAQQNISAAGTGGAVFKLGMSDADRALLPDKLIPVARNQLDAATNRISPYGLPAFVHAVLPVHEVDSQPARFVTSLGDIKDISFNTPKKSLINAGRDISNLSLAIQNINKIDVSIIEAGRDLVYPSNRDPLTGGLIPSFAKIEVAGPGELLVKTGRNVDLGTSDGLATVGNTYNTSLGDAGANITVLAGLNGSIPDYVKFLASYDAIHWQSVSASETITTFMHGLPGNSGLNTSAALLAFAALKPDDLKTADALSVMASLKSLSLPVFSKAPLPSDYVSFLNNWQAAKDVIIPFMRHQPGNSTLDDNAALLAFSALKSNDTLLIQAQLNSLLLPVQAKLNSLLLPFMFNEIKKAGTASAGDKSLGNAGGYAAIEALFPGNNWKGDLNLFFSKLQTLKGGDINMLVPGGQINAGLAVAFTGAKDATQLGIVAQREGAINAVLRDDFLVNKSRVFSLNGGDIMIWSSEGSIDAGKGAKSAISAPPPIVSLDKDGNLVVEFPPIVSGSGIRTASSSADRVPGDVYLFAPKGVIDAGEAGIGGSNVTISATAVLGANNIQVSGTSTGVPVASVGSVAAGLTGTSNVTANASQTAQAAMGADEKDKVDNKNMTLGMLSVELLGFGE